MALFWFVTSMQNMGKKKGRVSSVKMCYLTSQRDTKWQFWIVFFKSEEAGNELGKDQI